MTLSRVALLASVLSLISFTDEARATDALGCHTTPRERARHESPSRRIEFHGRSHRAACGCVERRVPGHYETRVEVVQEPGCYRREWVEPTFRIARVRGVEVRVQLSAGYYRKVWVPGRVKHIERRVWVPAHTIVDCHCRGGHRC
ncbi:MAG: hypothetical protein AB7O52_19640 [Planctomycetota bacterium]